MHSTGGQKQDEEGVEEEDREVVKVEKEEREVVKNKMVEEAEKVEEEKVRELFNGVTCRTGC